MKDLHHYPEQIHHHLPEHIPYRVRQRGQSAVQFFKWRTGLEFMLIREKDYSPFEAESTVERLIDIAMRKHLGKNWDRRLN